MLFRRGAERIIGRAEPARVTSDHDQRRCAFGIGRREQRAHRAALRIAEQRSPLRSNGVQHGAHVVHALFERRDVDHPIGKSGAALVEQDQASKGRQLAKKSREIRLLPKYLNVGDPAGHQHEVKWAVANNLIRNVDAAT